MLVLSRKVGEKIVTSNGVTITLVEITGNRVKIGIEAPPDVKIMRLELLERQTQPDEGSPKSEVV